MNDHQNYPLSDHMRQRTREWFSKAGSLLSIIEEAPFTLPEPPTNLTAALANMAMEYALKGYLMLNKQRIPSSHDLVEILNLCVAVYKDGDFENIRPLVEEMVRYRAELDYPGVIQETLSVEETHDIIRKARVVQDFILAKAATLGYS